MIRRNAKTSVGENVTIEKAAAKPAVKVTIAPAQQNIIVQGDPEMFKKSSAACYAWFIWEKGWTEKPMIEWI